MSSEKILIWGNGLEAEFGLFRNPSKTLNTKKIKYLFFDSKQLVNPANPYSKYIYYFYKKKIQKQFGIVKYPVKLKEAIEFTKEVNVEKAGKSCLGKTISGKDENYVYYLLETRTDYPISAVKNGKQYIEVFVNELQKNIEKVIKYNTIFKPEYIKKENKIIGNPTIYPYGMSSRILLRNLNTNEYSNGPTIENYTGSYHFTFTLPHYFAGDCNKNSKNHKFFANLIQWIEPLIASAFHSCDDRAIGNNENYTKGSYRVAMTGWGNFGGSDLKRIKCLKNIKTNRKNYDTFLEEETLYKYSYNDPKWRDNLPFKNSNLLEPCRKFLTGKQPSLGGDFRTPFYQEGYARKNKNNDTMISKSYTHGLEIRIFDWFHHKHLNSLGRILVMLAEHSRENQVPIFVYDDADWNEAVRVFMINGWRALMPEEYVKKLEIVFNLKLNLKSYRAYDIFKELINVLFKNTSGGEWLKLMQQKKYTTPPAIPKVNQKSWDFAFVQHILENKKDNNNFINFTNSLKDNFLIKDVKTLYSNYFPGKKWENDMIDILEFLQNNSVIKMSYDKKGNIQMIKRVTLKKLNLLKLFTQLFKG